MSNKPFGIFTDMILKEATLTEVTTSEPLQEFVTISKDKLDSKMVADIKKVYDNCYKDLCDWPRMHFGNSKETLGDHSKPFNRMYNVIKEKISDKPRQNLPFNCGQGIISMTGPTSPEAMAKLLSKNVEAAGFKLTPSRGSGFKDFWNGRYYYKVYGDRIVIMNPYVTYTTYYGAPIGFSSVCIEVKCYNYDEKVKKHFNLK